MPVLTTVAVALLAVSAEGASGLPATGQAVKGLPLVRSVRSGLWSAPATWEGGKVPGAGARVQVRTAHTVTYDLKSGRITRSVHVAGTLTFARDKDTRLDVGLICPADAFQLK